MEAGEDGAAAPAESASSGAELPLCAWAGTSRLTSDGADGQGAAEELAAWEHAEPTSQAALPAEHDTSLGDVPLAVGRGATGGQDCFSLVQGRDRRDLGPGRSNLGGADADGELVFANLNVSGRGLATKDHRHVSLKHAIERSSDPYLIFKQGDEVVTKTEVVKHNCDPDWKRLHLPLIADTPVVIEAWDWDRITADDFIGVATVSIEDLLANGKLIRLTSDGKTSGFVQVLHLSLYVCGV